METLDGQHFEASCKRTAVVRRRPRCYGVALGLICVVTCRVLSHQCNSQTWDIKAGSTGSTKREKWHHFENLQETQRSQRDFSFICFPSPFSFPNIPTIPIHSHYSHPPYPHPHPHSFPIPRLPISYPWRLGRVKPWARCCSRSACTGGRGPQLSPRAAWGPQLFRWI